MNKPLTTSGTRSLLADQSSPHSALSTNRAGQGTLVEQSRAIAEVQASVVIAQNCPRDVTSAMSEMRTSCAMPRLAERAFFRFPRGGTSVSGKSVHLARELARCWGNIVYGVKELRRDDEGAESEMLAYAWDLQTNARNETVFIVPHKRDKKGGPEVLTDMRDIYENNANNGARRLRECIFAVMPPWYVEEAAELCQKTMEDGGGVPLVKRITDCAEAFKSIGVTKAQLERKVGRKADDWLAEDLAQLTVIFKSIRRGEINKADEFPPDGQSQAETASQALKTQASPAAEAQATASTPNGSVETGRQEEERPSLSEPFVFVNVDGEEIACNVPMDFGNTLYNAMKAADDTKIADALWENNSAQLARFRAAVEGGERYAEAIEEAYGTVLKPAKRQNAPRELKDKIPRLSSGGMDWEKAARQLADLIDTSETADDVREWQALNMGRIDNMSKTAPEAYALLQQRITATIARLS